ncbi:MAG: hypothetical protein ABIJ05_03530 [Patescibacteria group bacterium]
MKIKSEGKCTFCNKIFSGSSMSRHLASCPERKIALNKENSSYKVCLLKVSASPFWIYFEISGSATLEDIDSFLRNEWLECCGHLSMFKINNQTYACQPQPEYGDEGMNVKLYPILNKDIRFSHEYDFGSTTYLDLKCLDVREGELKEPIVIIAQNNLPDFKCKDCDKSAKKICTECLYEGDCLFCEECAEKHEHDEEMFLPIVNSPRMGVCGYTGDAGLDRDFFD